jgi:hypothetical protein
LIVAIVGAAGGAAAMERFALHLGVGDGLTAEWVTSLPPECDGLMLGGTNGGLFRYDGTECRRVAPAGAALSLC